MLSCKAIFNKNTATHILEQYEQSIIAASQNAYRTAEAINNSVPDSPITFKVEALMERIAINVMITEFSLNEVKNDGEYDPIVRDKSVASLAPLKKNSGVAVWWNPSLVI